MNDHQSDEKTGLSVTEYLSIVFLNPVSLIGIVLLLGGAAFLAVTGPGTGIANAELYGGAALLIGVFVFAIGYSKAQREMIDQSPSWSRKND